MIRKIQFDSCRKQLLGALLEGSKPRRIRTRPSKRMEFKKNSLDLVAANEKKTDPVQETYLWIK
jgi:hypothetical protein